MDFSNPDFFTSPEFARTMGLMSVGDILSGGSGGGFFNYMGSVAQMQMAEQERQRQEAAAAAERARQQAAQQQALALTTDYLRSAQPTPVAPFNRNAPAVLAADTMAALGKGGMPEAAGLDPSMTSALNALHAGMPQDLRGGMRVNRGYQGPGVALDYTNPKTQEWVQQNAARFGVVPPSPQEPWKLQISGPGGAYTQPQIDPARAAAILQNPGIPDAIKQRALAQMFPEVVTRDTVVVGNALVDRQSGEVVYSGSPEDTGTIREYLLDVQQGYQGTLMDYKRELAAAGRQVTNVNVGQPGSPFWEELDKTFAGEAAKWMQGGAADTMKMIGDLTSVLDKLERGEPITGTWAGLMGDTAQSIFAPEMANARQRVEGVVQRNLKEILGAQFTQVEGERLIARAYNPILSPEQNAQRLKALTLQMQAAADAKQAMVDYASEHDTLRGYKGQMPSWEMFHAVFDELDAKQPTTAQPTVSPGAQEITLPDGSKYLVEPVQ